MWLLHPRNGHADQVGWQKAGSRPLMASSLSGQAQTRSLAPPGMWGGVRQHRHPLESFQTGRGYESTPRDKVQTTTWLGSQGPAFCLPSTAQPDQAPKSPRAPAPLTSRPCPAQAAPGLEHNHSHLQVLSSPISSSGSFPFPQAGSGTPSAHPPPPKPLGRLASLEHCFSSPYWKVACEGGAEAVSQQ